MKLPTLTMLYTPFAAAGILAAIPTLQAAKAAVLRVRRTVTKVVVSIAALAGLLMAPSSLHAQKMSDLTSRLDSASQVIREIESVPDGGIPDFIVSKANCIAVIPSVKKGAFIVGASYGQGVVTCRTQKGWSAPVFIRLAGGSFGFQIGGQATDLVLVSVNDKGFQDLLHSKFKIGGDASAAAGPVGRHATASTDILLHAELLSYSRTRGIFAGVDLNGAVVSQNAEDTNLLYGEHAKPYADILHGNVPVPSAARSFVSTVARYFRSTR
jgi:SH3 domain-containing YSC84-like protein 1